MPRGRPKGVENKKHDMPRGRPEGVENKKHDMPRGWPKGVEKDTSLALLALLAWLCSEALAVLLSILL